MNVRNNPGPGSHSQNWHGAHRQGMNQPNRSLGAKSGGFGFVGDLPVMPPTAAPQAQNLLPAVLPDAVADTVDTASGSSKASGFSLANLGEIKGFVDRIGGLDGILSTMTKVQKVVSSVTQMAPLVKVLMGSFGKKSATVSEDTLADDGEWRPKRRRRRKPSGRTGKGNSGNRRRPTKRRR